MLKFSMLNQMDSYQIALFLFITLVICFWLGILVRSYKERKGTVDKDKSIGALEGSLLGLLALLLSFTFSMSSTRHDKRVQVIIEEANDIGTAVLRADLYPDSIRNEFRKDFRAYLESRILFYTSKTDLVAVNQSLLESARLQASLWKRATDLGRDKENLHRTAQMIPALNEMFDIVTTRTAVTLDKVPDVILYLMFLICITAAFMVGYSGGSKPDWVIVIGFSMMISMTVYLIMDLDRPRRGMINMDQPNENIVQLRQMFKN